MKRVAAYCRVSTEKEDQANSLASQQSYFTQYISHNPQWELGEVYVDEGITGTSTKKRVAFQQMIAAAQAHLFDLILTKEISRFARNTLDSIFYTRKLKELGIGVIFVNDNINTLDPDAELRLTIMSSIAQEESRKTSERVKWGQKRRMEQGVVFGRDLLGYTVRKGKLFVHEDGAEIVKLIFHKFVYEGKGTHCIARELREAGIVTATRGKQWSNTVILRMLRNEKYCGDLTQKKTITPNYLNHEKKYNHGEEAMVVLTDHHEAIISRTLFDAAQRELVRRSPDSAQKEKYTNRYCFSGKIKCEICGKSYVSRTKKRKNGTVYRAWRCYESARHGRQKFDKMGNQIGCDAPGVNESQLQGVLCKIVKSLQLDQGPILNDLWSIIQGVLQAASSKKPAEKLLGKRRFIAQKQDNLLDLYVSQEITQTEYRHLSAKYKEEDNALKVAWQEANAQRENVSQQEEQQQNTWELARSLVCGEVWDEIFYRNLVDKMTLRADDTVQVQFYQLPQCFCAKRKEAKKDVGIVEKEPDEAATPEKRA